MCFIEGRRNRRFFRRFPTAQERKAHVVAFLGRAFNDTARAAAVTDVVEHDWAKMPYTRGAYSSFFPPGVISGFWDEWHDISFNHSVGLAGIHVAGGDFGGNGMGYIDGAVQTGQKAAERIMAAINNRNNYD